MAESRPTLERDRVITLGVWACVGAWGVLALIRLLGLERGFPLVALLAFTPWIGATSVVPVGLAAALRRWAALAAALAVAAVFAALLLPRAVGGTTDADGGEGTTLRVLAANVQFGEADPDELIALAAELDVDALVLCELTPRFAAAVRRAGIASRLPHAAVMAERRAAGTGIYSRMPLRAVRRSHLPGGFALPRARLVVPGAESVALVGVHAAPPTEHGSEPWAEDLDALPAARAAVPTILAGDFNATLDHAEFRELLGRGYADAAATLGEGLTPTWPAERRLPPLIAIDHVLADERLGVREFSAHDITGADHRAVFAEIELPARRGG